MKSNSTRVLVTGAGGGVGQSILKSFLGHPYSIVSADAEALGAGLYAAFKGRIVPYASDPHYTERIIEICKEEGCSLIFPGLDVELPPLSRNVEQLKSAGIIPVVSDSSVVDICDDKLSTHRFLKEHGFYAPDTVLLSQIDSAELKLPVILKPMKGGSRSSGVYLVSSLKELQYRLSVIEVKNYVAQEYVEGDEFTAGSVNFSGKCFGVIVMRRTLRDGDTYKAFVVNDPQIYAYLKEVSETLAPFGPCNFQFRLNEGRPYIFDINPRCSGTTYCRTLAGFNEPLMTADYLLQGQVPSYSIREVTILRYWKELLVENSQIEAMRKSGSIDIGAIKI